MLTYIDIDDSIDYYVVQEEYKLIDLQNEVEVIDFGGSSMIYVTVDKFLTHKSMILSKISRQKKKQIRDPLVKVLNWYFWEKRMMFLHMIHKGHILLWI